MLKINKKFKNIILKGNSFKINSSIENKIFIPIIISISNKIDKRMPIFFDNRPNYNDDDNDDDDNKKVLLLSCAILIFGYFILCN